MSTPLVLLPGIDGQSEIWNRVVTGLGHQKCWSMMLPKGDLKASAHILLSQISVNEFFLCGLSYGGLVARAVAEVAPERVKGVCMVGTLPHRAFCPPHIQRAVRLIEQLPGPVFPYLYRQRLRRRLKSEDFSPLECQVLSKVVISKQDYLQRLRAVLDWDLADRIDVPTLLLKGLLDSEAPWTLASAKDALCGVDVRLIPGGHRAPWTHADSVVQVLREWMRDVQDKV